MTKHTKPLKVWKGLIPYRESLTIQQELKQKALKSQRAFFLGFECPACITLGLRGQKSADLKWPLTEYAQRGIEIVPIKRGGQATLHSLGQLVIYPVIDLRQWKVRPKDLLSLLEKITTQTCEIYKVFVKKGEDQAGLFTEKGKLAFFGIHISQGVSQHGLSLNVKNDLKLFELINSCGVSNRPHDSLQKQGVLAGLEEVFSTWCDIATPLFIKRL